MSDKKRIEQEPLYSCCQCYDEYSWNKEDLRWYKNDLWCANCFDELDEDGERMLWSDLEPFTPKADKELAEARAEIERLKRENIELLVKCDEKFDVIDRKDKLIEQMREALVAAKNDGKMQSAITYQLIRAALSAADGGERWPIT